MAGGGWTGPRAGAVDVEAARPTGRRSPPRAGALSAQGGGNAFVGPYVCQPAWRPTLVDGGSPATQLPWVDQLKFQDTPPLCPLTAAENASQRRPRGAKLRCLEPPAPRWNATVAQWSSLSGKTPSAVTQPPPPPWPPPRLSPQPVDVMHQAVCSRKAPTSAAANSAEMRAESGLCRGGGCRSLSGWGVCPGEPLGSHSRTARLH